MSALRCLRALPRSWRRALRLCPESSIRCRDNWMMHQMMGGVNVKCQRRTAKRVLIVFVVLRPVLPVVAGLICLLSVEVRSGWGLHLPHSLLFVFDFVYLVHSFWISHGGSPRPRHLLFPVAVWKASGPAVPALALHLSLQLGLESGVELRFAQSLLVQRSVARSRRPAFLVRRMVDLAPRFDRPAFLVLRLGDLAPRVRKLRWLGSVFVPRSRRLGFCRCIGVLCPCCPSSRTSCGSTLGSRLPLLQSFLRTREWAFGGFVR